MVSKHILAVDPGITGSVALLLARSSGIALIGAYSIKHTPGWKEEILFLAKFYDVKASVIETVHAFPGQGVSSAFTFGTAYGEATATLQLARCAVAGVEPKAWQRRLGLPHHSDISTKAKRRTAHRKSQKELALKLFPELAKVKGDIFASVLIGYAACLDILCVPLGQIYPKQEI